MNHIDVIRLAQSLRNGTIDTFIIEKLNEDFMTYISLSTLHVIENDTERDLWPHLLFILAYFLERVELNNDEKELFFNRMFGLYTVQRSFEEQEYRFIGRCIKHINYEDGFQIMLREIGKIFAASTNHYYYLLYFCGKLFPTAQLTSHLEFIIDRDLFNEKYKISIAIKYYFILKERGENVDVFRQFLLDISVENYFQDCRLSQKYLNFLEKERGRIDFSELVEKSKVFIENALNENGVSEIKYDFIHCVLSSINLDNGIINLIRSVIDRLMSTINEDMSLYTVLRKFVFLSVGRHIPLPIGIEGCLLLKVLCLNVKYECFKKFEPNEDVFFALLECDLIDCEKTDVRDEIVDYIARYLEKVKDNFRYYLGCFLQAKKVSDEVWFTEIYGHIALRIYSEVEVAEFSKAIMSHKEYQGILNEVLRKVAFKLSYEERSFILDSVVGECHQAALCERCKNVYLLIKDMSAEEFSTCKIENFMERLYENQDSLRQLSYESHCLLYSQRLRYNYNITDEEIRRLFDEMPNIQSYQNVLLQSMLDNGRSLMVILQIIRKRHGVDFSKVFKNVFGPRIVEETERIINEIFLRYLREFFDLGTGVFVRHHNLTRVIVDLRYIYYYIRYYCSIDRIDLPFDELIDLISNIETQIKFRVTSDDYTFDDDDLIAELNKMLNKNLKCILQYLRNKGYGHSVYQMCEESINTMLTDKSYIGRNYELVNRLYSIPEEREEYFIPRIVEFLESDPSYASTKLCLEYLITLNIKYYESEKIFKDINNLYDYLSNHNDLLTILLSHIDNAAQRVIDDWYPDYILDERIPKKYTNKYITFLMNLHPRLHESLQQRASLCLDRIPQCIDRLI